MSNKKQTAVELYEIEIDLLIEKYESKEISKREFITMKHNIFYQAKEMEKQQIINAWYIGVEKEGEEHGHTFLWHRKDLAEQYYKETFNNY
jgi:hypothetical protein